MTDSGLPSEKMGNRSCPACGSNIVSRVLPQKIDRSLLTEFSYASRKPPELMHLELWKCTKCETLYCPKPDSQTFLADEYGSAAYDSGEEAVDAAVAYADNLEKLLNLRDLSVLDVGAGDGAFISECQKRGAKKIFGIEPSKAAIDSASTEIQNCLELGTLDIASNILEKFDLATLFMTIEHVADPNDSFVALKRCLNVDGRIAIVCHNRLSFVNRVLRTKSPIFDIEHQQIFSKKGIVFLFERMDMEVEYVHSFKNKYSLQYWIRLLPIPKSFRGFFERLPSSILSKKLALNVGNIMIIGRVRN